MKKTLIKGLILIILGFFLGQIIFSDKIELMKKLQKGDTYYFLGEGIYNSYDSIQNNININRKIIESKNNKYYVYVGITRDKEVLEKLKEIYKKKNISLYTKEIILSSPEFKTNVEQFDLLIKNTKDYDQILTIEEVVIANYEEIIKKQ